jgi:DNA-binding NarL/FixJ family response regulator
MPVKVLLADDTTVMRRAIRNLFQDASEIKLVAEAENFAQTLIMMHKFKPQVIVLDLHMPLGSKLEMFAVKDAIRSSGTHVLAISVFNDDETKDLAKEFGATVLLDKMVLGQELIPAVRALALSGIRNFQGRAVTSPLVRHAIRG